jgi:hypothetical protein
MHEKISVIVGEEVRQLTAGKGLSVLGGQCPLNLSDKFSGINKSVWASLWHQ